MDLAGSHHAADELGAEHVLVVTERVWALEQLAVIERESSYRFVSCVVDC